MALLHGFNNLLHGRGIMRVAGKHLVPQGEAIEGDDQAIQTCLQSG